MPVIAPQSAQVHDVEYPHVGPIGVDEHFEQVVVQCAWVPFAHDKRCRRIPGRRRWHGRVVRVNDRGPYRFTYSPEHHGLVEAVLAEMPVRRIREPNRHTTIVMHFYCAGKRLLPVDGHTAGDSACWGDGMIGQQIRQRSASIKEVMGVVGRSCGGKAVCFVIVAQPRFNKQRAKDIFASEVNQRSNTTLYD